MALTLRLHWLLTAHALTDVKNNNFNPQIYLCSHGACRIVQHLKCRLWFFLLFFFFLFILIFFSSFFTSSAFLSTSIFFSVLVSVFSSCKHTIPFLCFSHFIYCFTSCSNIITLETLLVFMFFLWFGLPGASMSKI